MSEGRSLMLDFPPKLRKQILKAQKGTLRELARLAVRHRSDRVTYGRILNILALEIAKKKKDKRAALHVLRMARRFLVDEYEWLRQTLLDEWGIGYYCDMP